MELIKASVHDIVDFFYREGDIILTMPPGPIMAAGGVRHREIQEEAPQGYVSEHPLNHRITGEYVVLQIQGRVDGILPLADGVRIEEIKSTGTPLDSISSDSRPDHWAQAKIYAAMLIFQGREAPQNLPVNPELLDGRIEICLCYADRNSPNTVRFTQTWEKEKLTAYYDFITEGYLDWVESIGEWQQRRSASIPAISFPFPSYRKGQELMCREVEEAISQKRRLYIHAPTGIGKTAAVLFPAIKSLSQNPNRKIFYLTAMSSGKETAENTLELMRKSGLQLKSLTLTAKSKICFILKEFGGDSPPCDPEVCSYAKGHYSRVKEALASSLHEQNMSRETVETYAREYHVCPFEFSLDSALQADVIICDYNYVFDPRVRLIRFFQHSGNYLFLIDEAHNLIDRGRSMFSSSIEKRDVLELKRIQKESSPGMSGIMAQLNSVFISIAKEVPQTAWYREYPEEIKPLIEEWISLFEWDLKHKRHLPPEAYDFYYKATAFVKVCSQYNESYRTLIRNSRRNLDITLSCINPQEFLKKGMEKSKSSILFSATLSPVSYHTSLITGGDGAVLELESPFPASRRLILADASLSTRYRDRERTAPEIARRIAELAAKRKGKYIAYFPSYAYLSLVREHLESDYGGELRIESQTRGMDDEERGAFLGLFDNDHDVSLVVLGVMGGLFGEGIDLKGDKLTGAVIVGVGLPQIGPERDIIKEYFNESLGRGFDYAYTYPGFAKVLQAAGRVIRSEEDRGVILFIGSRFGNAGYLDLFPAHMHPDRLIYSSEELDDALSEFWLEFPH